MAKPSASDSIRDTVVIGGGLAGCAAAYFLAREGVDVLLLERRDLNSGASGANAGSIHLQIPSAEFSALGPSWTDAFAPALDALRAGAEFWEGLPAELGADLEYCRTGGVIAATSEAGVELIGRKAEIERERGIQVEILDSEELLAKAPYLSTAVAGGAWYPGEGKANPLLATAAFARAAVRSGAEIRTQTPVVGIDAEGPGFSVETPNGRIASRRIVCAAGEASGLVAGMLGLEFGIQGFPIQISVTEPAAPLVEHLVYSAEGRLTVKQMANGTCLIGGGWPSARNPDGTLSVSHASLVANLKLAADLVPALAALRIVRAWPAIVNGTSDWLPVIGETPSMPGFHMNFFPWMGFTGLPAASLALARAMTGKQPQFEISAFAPKAKLS